MQQSTPKSIKSQISDEEFFSLKRTIGSGRSLAFHVATGSMAPLIKPGDLIILGKKESPEVYDILVFRQHSILVCHFIKHINSMFRDDDEAVYVTGNLVNLLEEDLPVSSRDVLGVVTSHRLPIFTKANLTLRKLLRSD